MKPTNPVWLVFCVVGVVLAVCGFAWGSTSNQTVWTEAQATKRAEASARFHAAAHAHGDHAHDKHSDSTAAEAELAAAKKEFDEQQAKFAAAVGRRDLLSGILKWGGLALAAVGGGGYLITNRAAEDDE